MGLIELLKQVDENNLNATANNLLPILDETIPYENDTTPKPLSEEVIISKDLNVKLDEEPGSEDSNDNSN